MYEQLRQPRVVVGVDDSLTGLAALRVAVDEARRRRVPLYAVRVPRNALPGVDEGLIEAAFRQALGSVPTDIEVRFRLALRTVRGALLDCACDRRDLLVVGTSGEGRWHAIRSGSVECSVRHRADCEVRAVRAPAMTEFARELHRDLRRGDEYLWRQVAPATNLRNVPQRGDRP